MAHDETIFYAGGTLGIFIGMLISFGLHSEQEYGEYECPISPEAYEIFTKNPDIKQSVTEEFAQQINKGLLERYAEKLNNQASEILSASEAVIPPSEPIGP